MSLICVDADHCCTLVSLQNKRVPQYSVEVILPYSPGSAEIKHQLWGNVSQRLIGSDSILDKLRARRVLSYFLSAVLPFRKTSVIFYYPSAHFNSLSCCVKHSEDQLRVLCFLESNETLKSDEIGRNCVQCVLFQTEHLKGIAWCF